MPARRDFLTQKNHKHEVCGFRAIDGTRTRDFHLGKVALYQLSHYRICYEQIVLYYSSTHLSTVFYDFFAKPAAERFLNHIIADEGQRHRDGDADSGAQQA